MKYVLWIVWMLILLLILSIFVYRDVSAQEIKRYNVKDFEMIEHLCEVWNLCIDREIFYLTEAPVTHEIDPLPPIPQVNNEPIPEVKIVGNYGKAVEIIKKYDWNVQSATKIAQCESNFRYDAKNEDGESSHGLFQINLDAHSNKIPGNNYTEKVAWLQNREDNVKSAYALYIDAGWRPWWNCSKKLALL